MTTIKKQTTGYFDFVGMIKGFGTESFKKDLQGTNNQNWLYSKLSVMLTDGNGKNIYVNMQDGYDRVKGKTIFAQTQDDQNMQITFADRFNDGIRAVLKDNSFLKVATRKVQVEAKDRDGQVIIENGQPKMIEVWDYTRFLTLYDMVLFLSDKLTDGLKVRMTGQVKYREYNGNIQRELNVQRVYFLPEGDETPCEFKITQTVILDSDSVDTSKFEDENVVTLKSKIYQKKNKDEMQVLPLNLVIRTTPEKKDSCKRGVDMLYSVTGDTLRKITLECIINSGYIQTEATVDSIPKEMLELIEAGVFTKEDVLKSYTNKEKVDEILIVKPVIKDGQIAKDDEYYVKEDLENLMIQRNEDESVAVEQPVQYSSTAPQQTSSFDSGSLDEILGLC